MPSSLDPSDAAKPQLRAVRHRRRSRRQAGDVSVEDGSSLKPPSPSPSSSRSASRSPSAYDFLYTPEAAANLVNFVDFLGREHVTVEKEVLLESPKLIGAGTTMNVFAGNWNSRRVAVKSLKPERKPVRDIGITLEQDTDYRLSTRDFYTDVQSVMQEVLIMSRVLFRIFLPSSLVWRLIKGLSRNQSAATGISFVCSPFRGMVRMKRRLANHSHLCWCLNLLPMTGQLFPPIMKMQAMRPLTRMILALSAISLMDYQPSIDAV
jgi:hypothetical protein